MNFFPVFLAKIISYHDMKKVKFSFFLAKTRTSPTPCFIMHIAQTTARYPPLPLSNIYKSYSHFYPSENFSYHDMIFFSCIRFSVTARFAAVNNFHITIWIIQQPATSRCTKKIFYFFFKKSVDKSKILCYNKGTIKQGGNTLC